MCSSSNNFLQSIFSFVEGVEIDKLFGKLLHQYFNNVCQPCIFMMQRIFQIMGSVKMSLQVKTWIFCL